MKSEPGLEPYSLTNDEAEYIKDVLGMSSQVASERLSWEIAFRKRALHGCY